VAKFFGQKKGVRVEDIIFLLGKDGIFLHIFVQRTPHRDAQYTVYFAIQPNCFSVNQWINNLFWATLTKEG
jgi:hypothetical protein